MDFNWGNIDQTVQRGPPPNCLIPGYGGYSQPLQPAPEPSAPYYQQQPQQKTYRIVRQRSASELTEGRSSIVSSVSPVSPLSTGYSSYQPTPQRRAQQARPAPVQSRELPWIQPPHSRTVAWSLQSPPRGTSSARSPQQTRVTSWSPQSFSPLSPHASRNKPLPPLPSMGYSNRQDESPWTFDSPPLASPVQQRPHRAPRSQSGNPQVYVWSNPEILVLPSETRLEDPQRIRNLEQLQEAMMTIDSLDDDPSRDDGLREPHRGPRGVGWAISRSDFHTNSGPDRPPPPYIASQWDDIRYRRCSSAG